MIPPGAWFLKAMHPAGAQNKTLISNTYIIKLRIILMGNARFSHLGSSIWLTYLHIEIAHRIGQNRALKSTEMLDFAHYNIF